ncbi:unnamed protein product [Musa textilis]
MLGGVSRRWVASAVRSAGAGYRRIVAPLCSSTSSPPSSPSFVLRPPANKLDTHGELIIFHNGIFKPWIDANKHFLRCMTTMGNPEVSSGQESSVASPETDKPHRIKFKRLDKTAKHIMNILDKEAVDKVQDERDIPDIRPGYIIQLKVEVPENKRRISSMKGIVIARRNAGLNTTFRLRRLVSGVGVESVFPLYSPNIKEIKVVDKRKVRRAKLYYLRDRMNPFKK